MSTDEFLHHSSGADGPSFELLDRYLAGEATEVDEHAIRVWSEASPKYAARFAQIASLLRGTGKRYTDPRLIAQRLLQHDGEDAGVDGREPFENMRLRGGARERKDKWGKPVSRLGTRTLLSLTSRRALGIMTLFAISVVALLHHRFRDEPTLSMTPVTYATGYRQVTRITLSDGSHVTLAPSTRLRVDITGQRRVVTLTGEAYFDVAHSSADRAPFVVQTGAVQTSVLGTMFDIQHYADDRDVRVIVAQGKVMAGASRQLTLMAGTAARFTDSTAVAIPAGDVLPYLTWTHERLRFARTPTSEVLRMMGRWYGYDFRLADSTLATEPITATFNVRTIDETIETLELLLSVKADIHGHVITLHPLRTGDADPGRHPRHRDDVHDTFSNHKEVGR